MQLIGLTGRSGAGKNTAADYLEKAHGYDRMALADPIKEALQVMLGLPTTRCMAIAAKCHWTGCTAPRHGRCCRPWVPRGDVLDAPGYLDNLPVPASEQAAVERVVITDVRFDNEVHAIHARGGRYGPSSGPAPPRTRRWTMFLRGGCR